MRALKGKVAIITGGARGIGKGVAMAFARAGASVGIVDREEQLGRETEAEFQAIGPAVFIAADLVRHDALPHIIDAVVERFGWLDTLVNAARLLPEAADGHLAGGCGCVVRYGLLAHVRADAGRAPAFGAHARLGHQLWQWRRLFRAAHARLLCRRQGGIRGLSKVAATEWGAQGVRVNVVCPFANSPGVQAWSQHDPEAYAELMRKVPLARIGDCENDIGAAVVFLASDAARYVTGQTLIIDGGQTRTL